MSFWKVTNNRIEEVSETKLKSEKLLEENLEDWISERPGFLGEAILIIGRQIIIPGINDRLDILGLDSNGNSVIIELKRGKIKDPVDMQALRYASYLSKWKYEDFEAQAKSYIGKGNEEFNFNETFEKFCIDEGIEDVPDINSDQRIIIVGSEVKDRLGSVALWLREHSVDIKVIEIDCYKESGSILIQPRTIIPHAVNKFNDVGKLNRNIDLNKPWLNDGKSWHLDRRFGIKARENFLLLDSLIQENFDVQGPIYNQKVYITYDISNQTWLTIKSQSKLMLLVSKIKKGSMKRSDISKKLNIVEFEKEDDLSDKINLPSSIYVSTTKSNYDRLVLRIKDDFNISHPEFLNFLRQIHLNAYNIKEQNES